MSKTVKKKKVGSYVLEGTLGEGAFGKVRLAIHEETGLKCAVKVLEKQKLIDARCVDTVFREISIMKRLKHENIVRLIETLHSDRNIYIFLELCQGGELFDRVIVEKKFDELTARSLFQQLIDGIEYCHAMNIVHGDIKPENLLLSAEGTLKISDFGLALVIAKGQLTDITSGTQNYMAPEVVGRKESYDGRCADIWSAGVVLFVMLAGGLPFDEDTEQATTAKILRGEHRMFPAHVHRGARELIRKIFAVDPRQRITIENIKKDPWFKEGYDAKRVKLPEKGLDTSSVPLAQRLATTIRLHGDMPEVARTITEVLQGVCVGCQVKQTNNKIRVLSGEAVQITVELFPGQSEIEILCVFQRRRGESMLFRDCVQAVLADMKT